MRVSELAGRYAKAVFELAVENKTQAKVFDDLRSLEEVFSREPEFHQFLTTPLIKPSERLAVLKSALENKGLSTEAYDLVMLLARKNRLAAFHGIVQAYESESDDSNNVCRGTVRSATTLGQPDRLRIEETVEKVLNKKVIMTYKVDPSVIGGLIAEVGSYTFDDSIASHLQRMNEELKRRTV
jgi:F-type H+-transporting ATPase subunit delta